MRWTINCCHNLWGWGIEDGFYRNLNKLETYATINSKLSLIYPKKKIFIFLLVKKENLNLIVDVHAHHNLKVL
ncbi:hypothetical protein QFZ72_005806 [Bacillus sp. V2I10]|jgi:hypothetical protein|nr:hypothetical protein [Bacillus sp. V2I10]